MKKYLILFAIIGLPIALTLFLWLGGKNNYVKLPIMGPRYGIDEVTGDTIYHKIPTNFKFKNQEGETISTASFRGKIHVADVFYTSCPGPCKILSSSMNKVYKDFKDNPDILLVSYSIDPYRDSVSVLKEYAQRFNANSKQWLFLRGDKKTTVELAQKYYFLSTIERTGEQEYDHSEKLVLVDKEGKIRGYYDGMEPEEMKRLSEEIRVLLLEYKNNEDS